MNKLGYAQYQLTFKAPMLDLTAIAEPVIDIWSYVEDIPVEDLNGYILSDGEVRHVYQHPDGTFLHVLVSTLNKDVFLVVIIDLQSMTIHGHFLLDLLQVYGIEAHS
jgi:hypothetical protein